jgi:hypothetical protein
MPANQSKHQIKAEIHIYPNILPTISYINNVISKTAIVGSRDP